LRGSNRLQVDCHHLLVALFQNYLRYCNRDITNEQQWRKECATVLFVSVVLCDAAFCA
jgi:hypothetical protein